MKLGSWIDRHKAGFNPRPAPKSGTMLFNFAVKRGYLFQSASRSEERDDTSPVVPIAACVKFQSASRSEERDDASWAAAAASFTAFQSASRSEERDDAGLRARLAAASLFQSASRSEERDDRRRSWKVRRNDDVSIRVPLRRAGRYCDF